VRGFFRPEFLNRLDDIIIFNKLTRIDMDSIVKIQIEELSKSLLEQGIAITIDEKAATLLANLGFDSVYGARPLKRVIQRQIQDKLATMILGGAIGEGCEAGISTASDNNIIITSSKKKGVVK
jgi:ATP-dependent Clp protease ATP-binding subunit ClpB